MGRWAVNLTHSFNSLLQAEKTAVEMDSFLSFLRNHCKSSRRREEEEEEWEVPPLLLLMMDGGLLMNHLA